MREIFCLKESTGLNLNKNVNIVHQVVMLNALHVKESVILQKDALNVILPEHWCVQFAKEKVGLIATSVEEKALSIKKDALGHIAILGPVTTTLVHGDLVKSFQLEMEGLV